MTFAANKEKTSKKTRAPAGLHKAPAGFKLLKGFLDPSQQQNLYQCLLEVINEAPFFTPTMPRTGRPMSVRMSNCGSLGWLSDKNHGYRYQSTHPETGRPWPQIPETLYRIWQEISDHQAAPEACLINYYQNNAKMGLHQDRDEIDLTAPVVSISLGDSAQFRLGGTKRKSPTKSYLLHSGDVVVLGGAARLCYHGIDRISAGSSDLIEGGGRFNLTLRRVNPQ